MVGVARSKACKTCRARRKKCDEQRPKCGLCSRRGLECVYKTDLNVLFFVEPGAKLVREHPGETPDQSDGSSDSTTDSSGSSPDDLTVACLNTSYRLQARGNFFETYLPGYINRPATVDWLLQANDLSSSDKLLSVALDALSFSIFERKVFGSASLPKSQELYSRAVRGLSARLNDRNAAMEDSTLATTMILTAFETQTATEAGMSGWLPHVNGAAYLVRLRGERNNSSEFAKQLFLGTRLWDLVYNIGLRKTVEPSIRAKFESSGGPQSSFAKLFDILNTLPTLFEYADSVQMKLSNPSNVNESELSSEVTITSYVSQDLGSRLLSWYDELVLEVGGGEESNLFWFEPSEIYHESPPESPAKVFPTCINFLNLDIGQQLLLYWCGSLMMVLNMIHTERDLRQKSPISLSILPTDAGFGELQKKMMQLAMTATQSLEYFVQPEKGVGTVDFIGLPINLLYGFWNAAKAPQLFWFSAIFDKLRLLNTGCGDFIEAMAVQGGGGRAFRTMLLKQPPLPV